MAADSKQNEDNPACARPDIRTSGDNEMVSGKLKITFRNNKSGEGGG
jgi:hypothetical protein